MPHRFEEVIVSRERLREVGCTKSSGSALKFADHLDAHYRRFVGLAPLIVIATKGRDGLMDISPRGGPPGFVKVLDERTLAIPELPGNDRLDTLENLLTDPQVGMFFIVPGADETLRVSGTGAVVRDDHIAPRLPAGVKSPRLHLVVTVRQAFLHCPRCFVWSKLWAPEHWPAVEGVPTMAQAREAHGSERVG